MRPIYSHFSNRLATGLRAFLLLALLAIGGASTAQVVTIAEQNFSTTAPTNPWGYAVSGTNTTVSATNTGFPTNGRIVSGSDRSVQTANGRGQIVFDNLSTVGYKNLKLTLQVASASVTSGNGADAGDTVKLWVVTNTATLPAGNVTPSILVRGNSNALWTYTSANGATVAITHPNTTALQSGNGANANPGYNKFEVTLPGGTTSVRFFVRFFNDNANEIWCLGSAKLEGEVGSDPFLNAPASFANFVGTAAAAGASQVVNVSGGDFSTASGNVTASATSDFEVSLDNTTFSPSVNIPYTGSALASTPVYVRQATGAASPTVTGTLTISGGGATSVNIPLSGSRAAPFTPGNLAVSVIGTGVGALANTGNPLSISEYTTTGSLVNSINIPSYGSTAMTQSGAATSEGALSRNAAGTRLYFAGYNQTLPNSNHLANSLASSIARGAASIDQNGAYQLELVSNAAYSGNGGSGGNPRAATSTGSTIITSGSGSAGFEATGGIRSGAALANALVTDLTNVRCIRIVNGRIVFTTATAASLVNRGIVSLGNGLNGTTLGQTVTQNLVAPQTGSSFFDFAISPDGMTIYVANDQAVGSGTSDNEGGIMRYDFNTTTQTYDWVKTFPTSVAATAGPRFLNVAWGSPNVIYTTSGASGNNNLLKITDDGPSGAYGTLTTNGRITVLATAGANRWFRGVEFTPTNTPTPNINLTRGGISGTSGSFASAAIGNGSMGNILIGNTITRVFYVSGSALTSGNINVSVTNGVGQFFISFNPTLNFGSARTIDASQVDADGNLAAVPVYVQFIAQAPAGARTGTISVSGAGVVTPVTFDVSAASVDPTNYYLTSSVVEGGSADLTDLNNWTTSITGVGGTAPLNFTSDGQLFNVNKTISTSGSAFIVTGAGSEVRVSDNKTLTITAAAPVQSTISILGNGSLSLQEPTPSFNFGTIADASTITFDAAGAQNIPLGDYGNLVIAGTGAKTILNNTEIDGTLTVNGEVNCAANTSVFVGGNVVFGGSAAPTAAWLANSILRLNGSGVQTLSGNVQAQELRVVDKATGSVGLANDITLGSLTVNIGPACLFGIGAHTVNLSNNVSLEGNASSYTLRNGGTFRFNGTTGTQNIRNTNALNQAPVAFLPNIVVATTGSASLSFSPPAGGATINMGNLTINSTSSGAVNLNGNTVRVNGNLLRTAGNFAPSATSTVVLAGTGAQQIGGDLPFTVSNVRVDAGVAGSYTLTNTLNITGNFTRTSGGFNTNGNAVAFNGSSAQSIVNGSTTFEDLTISNAAGVTVSSGATAIVFGALSITNNSTLTTSGSVILRGDANRSGYLATMGNNATLNGNITVERYLQPLTGWYFLSMPIKGKTFLDLHGFSPLTGVPGFSSTNPNTFLLDDNVAANNGWVPLASQNQNMTGVGFRHFARFANIAQTNFRWITSGLPIIGDGVNNTNTSGEAYSFNTQMANVNLGYSLLGNPYPAPIAWTTSTAWTSTNLTPTIHKWDVVSKSYRTWNRDILVGTSTNGVIPSMSAFIVQADAPGAVGLTVTEDAKVTGTNQFVFRGGVMPRLDIRLHNGGEVSDEAIVLFSANGSVNRTRNDASKLMGGNIDLGLVVGGAQYTVKELNEQLTTQVVDLNVSSNVAGNHVLTIKGLRSLDAGMEVSLRDNVLGTITPITGDVDHSFSFVQNNSTASRFSLLINNRVTSLGNNVANRSALVYPNPVAGNSFTVQVNGANAGEQVVIRIMDAAGRVVSTENVAAQGVQDRVLVTTPANAGIYMVETTVAGYTTTTKLVVK